MPCIKIVVQISSSTFDISSSFW